MGGRTLMATMSALEPLPAASMPPAEGIEYPAVDVLLCTVLLHGAAAN